MSPAKEAHIIADFRNIARKAESEYLRQAVDLLEGVLIGDLSLEDVIEELKE